MKSSPACLARTLLASGAVALLSGCEITDCETEDGDSAVCAESLERYTISGGAIRPDPLPYAIETHITIDGIYGDINVEEGDPGEVSVVIVPFTYRGHSQDDAAADELSNEFDYSFGQEGDTIVLTTGRLSGATTGLGATIEVRLPADFEGELRVLNRSDGPINPGNIDVDFVGNAIALDVSTDALGDCTISGSPSVFYSRVRCDGKIDLANVTDDVEIESTGLSGNIRVLLTDISEAAEGGQITSEDGDIQVTWPRSVPFIVEAQATADGTVSEGPLPGDCAVAEASEASKTMECGEGGTALYQIAAGLDGVGDSNVAFDYR